MERTKEYSVVNDTLKALKNQGLSERYFQKGHSFSSAARYDHFDNSPYMCKPACRTQSLLYCFPGIPSTFFFCFLLFSVPETAEKTAENQ